MMKFGPWREQSFRNVCYEFVTTRIKYYKEDYESVNLK
jgi:hypothetical protein